MITLKSQKTEIDVPGTTKMTVYSWMPNTPGKKPVLFVIQEAFGVTDHIADVAQQFAREGFMTVSPELFHRTAPSGWQGDPANFASVTPHTSIVTSATIEADMRACIDWVRTQPDADAEQIASIGFCMGGRVSYLTNSWFPLKAAVSLYGGRIYPDLVPLAAEQKGPLLLMWGGLDRHIPNTSRRPINDALTAAKKEFIDIEFGAADHGFLRTGSPAYNPKAAAEAWALSLAFLKNRVRFS